MKKKILTVLMTAIMLISAFVFAGCSKPVELVETYQSGTRISLTFSSANYHMFKLETLTVSLYSDDTYVCQMVISEGVMPVSGPSSEKEYFFNPMATTTITRYGTYVKNADITIDETTIELNEATRIIYSTNISGGVSGALLPEGMNYCDTNDEEAAAKFNTEYFGDINGLKSVVGTTVTITAKETTHVIDSNWEIFDYISVFTPKV